MKPMTLPRFILRSSSMVLVGSALTASALPGKVPLPAPSESLGLASFIAAIGSEPSVVNLPDVWTVGDAAGGPLSPVSVITVLAVPWQGDITKYHTTLSGGGGRLKGVIKTPTTGNIWYKWVYGDGPESGVTLLNGGTWYTVEDTHAYSGAEGAPFTAQLVVADNPDLVGAISDPYLVKIEADTLDARINIAIDEALWWLYQQGIRADGVTGSLRTFDGTPFVYWAGGDRPSSTAAGVQAFQINGSKETGDLGEDPYAEYVAGGLTFLIMGYENDPSSPILRAVALGIQPAGDPDANANGIGIEVYAGGLYYPAYRGGQIMDAIIASGTPATLSGRDFVMDPMDPHIASYAEIIQDMSDMYAWGQRDGCLTTATDTGVQDLTLDGVPTSISLRMLNTQCNGGGTFELLLNGVLLGTVGNDPDNSCTCNPSIQVFTIDDGAALLAAWDATVTKTLRVTYTGGGYNSRVNATLDWGGGNAKTICVRSVPSNCFTDNLCDGYNGDPFDSEFDLSAVQTYFLETVCSAVGSWRYDWNYDSDDNSVAQWAAIGMIPAQEAPWSAVVPQWVKDLDDAWLTYSHLTPRSGNPDWGTFGYSGRDSGLGTPPGGASTPSGMVQLSFVDKTVSDPRWMRAERWMAENWDTGELWFDNAKENLYATYAMVKAMRLAKPAPVVNFAINGFDWYRGSGSHEGVAKALSDTLIANNGNYPYSVWEGNPLTTAWAVIMLKPALFAAAPIACFSAHPNPTFSDLPVAFDPHCSGHSELGKGLANLTKFEWDWDNDGTFDQETATPDIVSHGFHCDSVPCTFPVTLKVSDDATPALTATFVMDIRITDPPHPPVSRSKAIYYVSECVGDTLTLDGSDSFDPDEGLRQAGCVTCPFDTIIAWEWDFDGAPYEYTSATGEIVNLGAGFGGTFPEPGEYDIALRVTDNTALAYPDSGSGNLTDEAFAKVFVFQAGVCDLGATPGCDSVHLAWSGTGADSYHVYQSLTGPNADFVEVASTGTATSADIPVPATLDQDLWFRVKSVTGGVETMSGTVFVEREATDCGCIVDLKAAAKNRLVQLTWTPSAGATCYNVYRGLIANVPTDDGHRIAACVVTGVAFYNDTVVVNGTRYYYKVTKVVGGEETCVSNEVDGTPALPRRM